MTTHLDGLLVIYLLLMQGRDCHLCGSAPFALLLERLPELVQLNLQLVLVLAVAHLLREMGGVGPSKLPLQLPVSSPEGLRLLVGHTGPREETRGVLVDGREELLG